MNPAIRVEELGKCYQKGAARPEYSSLREALMRTLSAPYRNFRDLRRMREAVPDLAENNLSGRSMWALKDVSFEVQTGEVLGVVGGNGAGKSTLLKILSRITAPTCGTATLKGTVGSLLEVGTGFHGELTGRENVYLSGSILGMSERYIRDSFDEIVEFSGVSSYLDTPVKRYSSGMLVRLAFAVAAHLRSDILLVDEVLAVGDVEFQRKCLRKMSAVADDGRTILFVSHDLAAVQHLCDRVLVLERGRVEFLGACEEGVRAYLAATHAAAGSLDDRTHRVGSGAVRVTAVEFRTPHGARVSSVASGEDIDLWLHFERHDDRPFKDLVVGFMLRSSFDAPIAELSNQLTGEGLGVIPERGVFRCRLPRLALAGGTYRLGVWIADGLDVLDRIEHATQLEVAGGDFYGSGKMPNGRRGPVLLTGGWNLLSFPL